MSRPSHCKCACPHCGGHIEFPAEAAGMTLDCPHCGKPTPLTAPPAKSSAAGKIILFAAIALVILAAVIAGGIQLHHRAEEKARLQREAEAAAQAAAAEAEARARDPLAQAGWQAAEVRLEKDSGSSVVHATGALRNATDRRRFGVKIQLDVLDADGQKIGNATDYSATVEPRGEWQFKALVIQAKAAAAKVAAVEESP